MKRRACNSCYDLAIYLIFLGKSNEEITVQTIGTFFYIYTFQMNIFFFFLVIVFKSAISTYLNGQGNYLNGFKNLILHYIKVDNNYFQKIKRCKIFYL